MSHSSYAKKFWIQFLRNISFLCKFAIWVKFDPKLCNLISHDLLKDWKAKREIKASKRKVCMLQHQNLIFKNKKSLKDQELALLKILQPKEWENYKQQEKIMDLKTFGHKMEGLCIEMQWSTELNYIIINVYSHGTLWCLKPKGKIVMVLFYYYFYFALVVCFWE